MCIFKTFWGLAQGPGGNGGPRSCARPAGNFFAPAVPPPRSSARPRAYAGRDYPRSCARWPCAAPASSTHDSPDNGWTVSVSAIPGRCRDTASSHSDRPRSGAKRRARGRAGKRRARWREVHGHLRRGTLPLSFRGRRALHPRRDQEQRRMQRMCSGNPPQHAEPSIMRGQSWSASKHDQRATSTHKHAHVEAVHAGPVLVGVSARPLRHLDLTTFVRSRLSLCTPLQSESSHQNTTDKVRVFEPLVPFSVLHISHFCESSGAT